MIKKKHESYDESQRTYSVVYEAQGIEGSVVYATVPREERRASSIIAALLSAGADIQDDDATRLEIKAAIEASASIYRQAATVGWRDGGEFVSAFGAHSQDAALSNLLPPSGAINAYGSALRLQGNLSGWQQLAKIAYFSTAMMVCLAAVFAAPLLRMLGRPSFALMLFGPSRSGKSTAQWLAASSMGFAREEDMPNMKGTPAGIVEMAMAAKDHAVFLNEAGTAAGRKQHIHDAILTNCYAILGGRDVLRHHSWSGTTIKESFQNIVVISSELHPDEWAQRAGVTRDPGEMARLLAVPANYDNETTIFDRAEPNCSVETWSGQQFERLRDELPNQTGRAFEVYGDMLVKHRVLAVERARRHVVDFQNELVHSIDSPLSKDIVGKFSVLYAGGMTAIDAQVLPLQKNVVAHALKKACIASISSLPDPQKELAEDLTKLERLLTSGSILDRDRPVNLSLQRMKQADGIKWRVGDGIMYAVRQEALKRTFRSELRFARLLEHLDAEGHLQGKRRGGSDAFGNWAVTQDCWLDRYRPRSIKIFCSKGVESLRLP